ncbi:MAG: TolC family protein [Planctomycetes bacterium]|nr:TolC family protein [Planctomycetota bacterium]
MPHRRLRAFTLLPITWLSACGAASYAADADQEVQQLLAVETQRTLGDRAGWVVQPQLAPAAEPAPVASAAGQDAVPAAPPVAGAAAPVRQFDLRSALATAVSQNREFLARREGLFRSGLSLALTRFQFGPQFQSALSYLLPLSQGGVGSNQANVSLSASQILPTGGSVAVNGGLGATWPFGPDAADASYGSSAGVTLQQPLLRGAGRDIAYESLTQAERDITYQIRDFENFRESFTIQVTQRFFSLTSQKKTLANEDRNYESAVFDRKKAEALQQVGRNSEQEVFRARRREIEAKDQLINARADYDRALDDFKILLGLPTDVVLDIADEEPPYEPVRFEVGSAVAAALHNRLDLITARQQVEDVERALRISENSLLPDLDLTASFGLTGDADRVGDAAPDAWSSQVGLSMEVPLQRKSQRNAYRSALISLEQARRNLRLTEDQLELDIRDAVRRLRSLEERVTLQQGQIEQERGAVTVMEIRYEAGQVDNRDLLEARQALIDAQNALIRLKVEHFVARLNLLKDMGIFFVDDRGMWR